MNLFHKEFKQIISNKLFVITWIVILIFLSVFMVYTPNKNEKKSSPGAVIGITNSDNSEYSGMFVDFIQSSDKFSKIVKVETGSNEEIEEKFNAGELDAFIVIPDNFIANLMDIESVPVEVKVSDEDTVTAVLVSNILDSYEKYIKAIQFNITGLYDCLRASGMSYAKTAIPCFKVTYRLVTRVFEKDRYVEEVEIPDYRNASIVVYFEYSAIAIVIMYGSLFAGVDILKEKNYWVLNRYLITGRSRLRFVLTKTVFYSLALYLLVLIPSILDVLINHSSFNYLLLLLFLVYIVSCICFSIFLSLFTGYMNTFALTGNMLYIVSIMIGGGIIPIMYLPQKMQRIAEFTPTRLFIKNFLAVFNGKTFGQIYGQILICIAACTILTLCSCLLFRKGARLER